MSSFTGSTRPFDNDGYIGYDPRLPSQRFDSFSNLDTQSVKDSVGDSTPIFANQAFGTADQVFSSQPVTEAPSPSPVYSDGEGFSKYSPEQNDDEFDGGFGASDGPILPPPAEMRAEEGFALREWRRHNAMRLEEKDKKEKDMLKEIIEEANEYKVELYRKRSVTIENNKAVNREKEKLFLANREKFHAEAEKNYWKAIGELIPHEVPIIEKRGKDKEKKRSIVVIQGPKPGKPTDLSRMRQALLKLKHNPPAHMKPKPLPSSETKIDSKTTPPASVGASASSAPPKAATVATGKALAAF